MVYYAEYQSVDLTGMMRDILGGIGIELAGQTELIGNLLIIGIAVTLLAFIIRGSYGFSQTNLSILGLRRKNE